MVVIPLVCRLVIAVPMTLWVAPSHGQSPFNQSATYETCFTPGQDCEGSIVKAIAGANHHILFQAYQFTSRPIAAALLDAKKRGVDIRALLDKSQRGERYTGMTLLTNAGINTRIDDKVAIAHNKVIVIDDDTVITGSFNFTAAAQSKNAENVLIIRKDEQIARAYAAAFRKRWDVSVE